MTQTRLPAIVYHPAKVKDLSALRPIADRIADEHGWRGPRWYPTTVEDHGAGVAAAAVSEGADLVCALGGDGTVRNVATALAHTGTAMGVLGLGTGNLLARNLGLPHNDFQASFRAALTGSERRVDLGWVRFDDGPQLCFTVIIGMGMDAQTMARTDDGLKHRIGWPAYLLSGASTLVRPGFQTRMSVDGRHPTTTRQRTVLVCNCGLLPGGLNLVPQASIDDGTLDVVALSPHGIVGWGAVLVHVVTKRRRGHHLIAHQTSRTCLVRAPKGVLAQVDGDPVGTVHSMRTRVDPGALVVRV